MKELSIEQKAKRYDEVVAMAKECITHIPDESVNKYMLNMFPELKESEDEKVIRDIKVVLECSATKFFKEEGKMPIWYDRAVAWLEKQSDKPLFTFDDILALQCCMETVKKVQEDKDLYEKLKDLYGRVYDAYHLENQNELKSPDKAEPENYRDIAPHFGKKIKDSLNKVEHKFAVGDWITDGNSILHITNMDYGFYQFEGSYDAISIIDKKYRLWTIEDAKDGDVLAEDSCIFIIQKLSDINAAAKTYCTLFNDGDFDDGSTLYFDIDSTKPATQEQRDILFAKMKEAGYEWDKDEKELKKL